MSRRSRRDYSVAVETKVALQAVRGEQMVNEIARKHEVHRNQGAEWRRQLIASAVEGFGLGLEVSESPTVDLDVLRAKVGQQALEFDFLGRLACSPRRGC